MGHQDESAIAAMAAFRVCEGFVYAFFGGLSNATSVVVGNQIGAGSYSSSGNSHFGHSKPPINQCKIHTKIY